ncbi:hypothetical protein HY640_00425 [Candidatus Woesearchaeota archaeon]|nr:hypothetical protein [Candidatus Woesearchaeota archaeon]
MRSCYRHFDAVLLAVAVALSFFVSVASLAVAVPSGPVITPVGNETAVPASSSLLNTTGGSITTMMINSTTQNLRWKAFVGNVSGSLTLDDASGNTVFDWSVSAASGEIYATRFSGQVNWSGIGCSNLTHLQNEDFRMNHTSPSDNVSRTFSQQSHSQFFVGTSVISQNSCFSLRTYVNDSAQSTRFEEVVLYDGTNLTNGNVVFASILEQDAYGFNNRTYDFQMIVPEIGLPTWTSSTAYYFFVELS